MRKKKFLSNILIFVIIVSTLFSFSVSHAWNISEFDGESVSKKEMVSRLNALQTDNPFELTLSEICLTFGDYLMDQTVFIFKEEITIDRLVFNNVLSLNADFFAMSKESVVPDTTEIFVGVINNWYSFFKSLTTLVYLIFLVFVGAKVILGTASSKAKAQDLIIKWTIGMAILYLFPYVMRYSFEINQGMLDAIKGTFTNNNSYDTTVGGYIGGESELQYDQALEERSPEYISRNEQVYSVGTEEATYKYYKNYNTYKKRGDLMRIMRAMAGITGKFIYVALWLVMLWQLLILTLMYTKRYLMIAFLIIIFPITVIEYIVGATITGKSGGFSAWCMEFFLNVFIQTIHAVAYGVIGGVVTANIQNGMANGEVEKMNWIVLIIGINFIFEAERIVKKIIKANAESIKNAEDMSKDLKGKIKSKKLF